MLATESALAIAARLRRREVSAVELAEAALAAIERTNPALASWVDVSRSRALASARRADALIAAGVSAPFLGVPTGIKDHEGLRGHRTRLGSRAFRFLYAPVDGFTARTCRDAGFTLLGKLACSELTILPFIDSPPARNPHDPERYAGGSSGGSAAAIAAGTIPIAPASDGGGSIRIPAAFCGLVGVKPGRGTLPNPLGRFDTVGINTIGPLARTVRDAAALMDVLAGARDRFLSSCDAEVPRLRVRFLAKTPIVDVDPEHAAAAEAVARRLEQLGHTLSPSEAIEGSTDEFVPLMASLVAKVPLILGMKQRVEPTTRWLHERGRAGSQNDAREHGRALGARVLAWFGDADLVVSPTVPIPAPRVGAFAGLDGEGVFRAAAPIAAFTAPFNVSGQPAISLPLARSRSGLPIGVQLVGRPGADHLLLALATRLMA